MSRKFAAIFRDRIEYSFWLSLSRDGGVRVTANYPALGRDERALSLSVTLPMTLFQVPTLSATINVESPEQVVSLDVSAIEGAVRSAIGMDVDLRVNSPGERP